VMDPRVAENGVTTEDLESQYALGIEIIAAIQDTRNTIDRLNRAMAMVADGSDIQGQLKEIEAALVTDRTISSYPRPMLADQLSYLYSNSQRADQRPAEHMRVRLAQLVEELKHHETRLEQLLRTIT